MPDTSIAISLVDKVSPGMKSMTGSTAAFNKSLQEVEAQAKRYSSQMTVLQRDSASLKTKLEDASKAVKEAKKAYAEFGDEASKQKLQAAIEDQEGLQNALKDTQRAMSNARSELFKYGDTAQKLASSDIGANLMKSGLIKQLGSSLTQAGSAFVGSAAGQAEAAMINSIFGGLVSGVSTGALAGGAVGAVVGGVVGVASGAISAATEQLTEKDEVFKAYYTNLYETTKAAISDGIAAGSATAGSREQTQLAFAHRFGSNAAASAYLADVKEMAKDTNYDYDEITGYSKSLLNTYSADEVFGVLKTLSDASAGLDLSSSDVNMFISGLSRMRTTGKTTQEYLNYFSERGVDVYTALGRTLGVDKSKIAGMVTGGEISGETAAQSILDFINAEFGGLSEKLAGTYDAMVANLEDVMTNVQESYGIGYNETRKSGISAESAAYDGALGAAVSNLNTIAGSNQAYLDNLAEQYKREALSAVLLGEATTLDFGEEGKAELRAMREAFAAASAEYAETGSREAALTMQNLQRAAESMATAAYEDSEAYQMVQDAELELVEETRNLAAKFEAWTNAYDQQQERSKGFGAITRGGVTASGETVTQVNGRTFVYSGGYAYGLDRVPYDNFPALLHEGERVKTAAEARAEDRAAGGVQVILTGNNFEVRNDSDIEAIAEAVAEQFRLEALAGVYKVS